MNNLLSPDIIFFSETKNKVKYIEKVMRILHFDECYVTEAMKKVEGMALF